MLLRLDIFRGLSNMHRYCINYSPIIKSILSSVCILRVLPLSYKRCLNRVLPTWSSYGTDIVRAGEGNTACRNGMNKKEEPGTDQEEIAGRNGFTECTEKKVPLEKQGTRRIKKENWIEGNNQRWKPMGRRYGSMASPRTARRRRMQMHQAWDNGHCLGSPAFVNMTSFIFMNQGQIWLFMARFIRLHSCTAYGCKTAKSYV